MALDIQVENLKRVSLVKIAGRVDSSNARDLEQALQKLMAEGYYQIVADLAHLEYISSAGLHVLISTLKECRRHVMGGDLRLCNMSERIAEVLDLAGMIPLFQIFDSTVRAVGSF